MAKEGKLIRFVGPFKPTEILKYELPEVEPGATLVKTDFAGVCGSDVHTWEGLNPSPDGFVALGHEGVATIYKLGKGVTTDHLGTPVREGDKVIIYNAVPCGKCDICLHGDAGCPNWTFLPPEGIRSFDETPHFIQGYAEYIYFRPGIQYLKIPQDLPIDITTVFGCAGPTDIRAFQYAGGIQPTETVLVQGSGPIGLFAVLYAKTLGASCVINVGGPRNRLDKAKLLGADYTLDVFTTEQEARVKKVLDLTGGNGVDFVFDGAGMPAAVPEAMEILKRRGRWAVVGQLFDRGTIPIKPDYITTRQYQIFGSHAYTVADVDKYLKFMEMVKSKYSEIRSLISVFAPEDAEKALEAMRSGEAIKPVIKF